MSAEIATTKATAPAAAAAEKPKGMRKNGNEISHYLHQVKNRHL
jgi:hypothetical protein